MTLIQTVSGTWAVIHGAKIVYTHADKGACEDWIADVSQRAADEEAAEQGYLDTLSEADRSGASGTDPF